MVQMAVAEKTAVTMWSHGVGVRIEKGSLPTTKQVFFYLKWSNSKDLFHNMILYSSLGSLFLFNFVQLSILLSQVFNEILRSEWLANLSHKHLIKRRVPLSMHMYL